MGYLVDENSTVSVDIFIDTRTNKVLSNEEILKFGDKIPDYVKKETSIWRKESWGIGSKIDSESIVTDVKTGKKEVDLMRLTYARIKYLLKEWTLSKTEPSLVLNTYDVELGIKALKPDVMTNIMKVDKQIINMIHMGIIEKIYGGTEETKN